MASKKIRFDIFKRDGFKCQYCGRTPPEIVLELDHVQPKSKGGDEDINNYLTACFDCNRGKGSDSLNNIPNSLVNNLKQIKEKQLQISEYNKYLDNIQAIKQHNYDLLDNIYNSYFPNYTLSDNFKYNTLNTFLQHLPLVKIQEALHMGCSKRPEQNRSLQYFCGICWNWIKYPETRGW